MTRMAEGSSRRRSASYRQLVPRFLIISVIIGGGFGMLASSFTLGVGFGVGTLLLNTFALGPILTSPRRLAAAASFLRQHPWRVAAGMSLPPALLFLFGVRQHGWGALPLAAILFLCIWPVMRVGVLFGQLGQAWMTRRLEPRD